MRNSLFVRSLSSRNSNRKYSAKGRTGYKIYVFNRVLVVRKSYDRVKKKKARQAKGFLSRHGLVMWNQKASKGPCNEGSCSSESVYADGAVKSES